MSELGFGNQSDFDLKIASLGPLLVCFLVEIWSDKSLILRFPGLIFCLAALVMVMVAVTVKGTTHQGAEPRVPAAGLLLVARRVALPVRRGALLHPHVHTQCRRGHQAPEEGPHTSLLIYRRYQDSQCRPISATNLDRNSQ